MQLESPKNPAAAFIQLFALLPGKLCLVSHVCNGEEVAGACRPGRSQSWWICGGVYSCWGSHLQKPRRRPLPVLPAQSVGSNPVKKQHIKSNCWFEVQWHLISCLIVWLWAIWGDLLWNSSSHCRTHNNLFLPENMARLSETFCRTHDLMDYDKKTVLGKWSFLNLFFTLGFLLRRPGLNYQEMCCFFQVSPSSLWRTATFPSTKPTWNECRDFSPLCMTTGRILYLEVFMSSPSHDDNSADVQRSPPVSTLQLPNPGKCRSVSAAGILHRWGIGAGISRLCFCEPGPRSWPQTSSDDSYLLFIHFFWGGGCLLCFPDAPLYCLVFIWIGWLTHWFHKYGISLTTGTVVPEADGAVLPSGVLRRCTLPPAGPAVCLHAAGQALTMLLIYLPHKNGVGSLLLALSPDFMADFCFILQRLNVKWQVINQRTSVK